MHSSLYGQKGLRAHLQWQKQQNRVFVCVCVCVLHNSQSKFNPKYLDGGLPHACLVELARRAKSSTNSWGARDAPTPRLEALHLHRGTIQGLCK